MRMRALIATSLTLAAAVSSAEPLRPLERQRLVAHMEMTARWLEDQVAGLSPAQLAFKPSATAWSILEVVDHLVVVGPIYWKNLQSATPVSSGRVGAMNDVDVLWYGIDRTNREIALPTEEPSRKLPDLQGGLKAYRAQHAELLQYVRTTKDDLRSPPGGAAALRRLSVGAAHLDARTAPHPSDSRDQGEPEVPALVMASPSHYQRR